MIWYQNHDSYDKISDICLARLPYQATGSVLLPHYFRFLQILYVHI